MEPNLTASGTKRLNLKFDALLSILGFNSNLRRYNVGGSRWSDPASISSVMDELTLPAYTVRATSVRSGGCPRVSFSKSECASAQGLTLAHFRAQVEDLRDTSLTLELNLST
jgi:hypothetical protein